MIWISGSGAVKYSIQQLDDYGASLSVEHGYLAWHDTPNTTGALPICTMIHCTAGEVPYEGAYEAGAYICEC